MEAYLYTGKLPRVYLGKERIDKEKLFQFCREGKQVERRKLSEGEQVKLQFPNRLLHTKSVTFQLTGKTLMYKFEEQNRLPWLPLRRPGRKVGRNNFVRGPNYAPEGFHLIGPIEGIFLSYRRPICVTEVNRGPQGNTIPTPLVPTSGDVVPV